MIFINKKKHKSKLIWLKNHFSDYYVKKVHNNFNKFRSRSWFKLEELHNIDYLFKKGMNVIDFGSSPGGWSSFASLQIGETGKIIANDILSMEKIYNVDFIQGNLLDINIYNKLEQKFKKQKTQIIMSDMAPNMTGIKTIDIPKSIYLNLIVLNLCKNYLVYNGSIVMKIFQSNEFQSLYHKICKMFDNVRIRKPNSSKTRSCEIYIVAKGYKKYNFV
ncbi:RlmE family RNA methyltransferase [Enterobacteriaceae endosymbiont of Macroplea appendiculata]|uniref:RlmE family RNA methyltransferase n=1 Tax=Enterobacteriaceae endosymbiont of Macroplea appendiculata TaxID=2675790 RepID=UPI001449E7DC|nr:SAM-dependent methyltransferase [Enterobacteriaceae endosymbiont of Macroplea appendiculata]QJC30918.1 23S rRNA (uridine(2552)-2'-O)-methyltransferase [Enterobacteriaceae endosymbiont of Macroplea appendiculata]